MNKTFSIFLVSLLSLVSFSISVSDLRAASPLCNALGVTNTNPITKIIAAKLGSSGQIRDITASVGEDVALDATAKDANSETLGRTEPVWTFTQVSGNFTFRNENCYTPHVKLSSVGAIRAYVTQDGVRSNEVSIHTAGVVVPPGSVPPNGAPVSGDPSRTDEYCAYKNTTGRFYCVTTTANDLTCVEFEPCKSIATTTHGQQAKCERKTIDQCDQSNNAMLGGPVTPANSITTPPPQDLGQLIQSIFNWSLSIVGLAVFLSILYAGVLRLLAAGNPSIISKANGIISNALLGALLLLSAYIILRTINPDFVGQRVVLPTLSTPTPNVAPPVTPPIVTPSVTPLPH